MSLRPAVPVLALLTAASAAAALPVWREGAPEAGAQTSRPRSFPGMEVTPLPSPAGIPSGQPQLTTSSRGVLLSWIDMRGRTATLAFAERTPGGWTEPRVVASGDDWFVNWADVPSVVRLADGTLAAHWLQKSGAGTYAYDVRLSFSTDDGRTWSSGVTPHSDGTRTEHGFASLFDMPGGGLGLVWLDGRAMAGGHEAHGIGEMSLRAGVFGPDGRQRSEVLVDGRVCECCPTAAAVTADGPIVAYRDRTADEVRDIHVSRLENGRWTEGVPVHADNWRIPACPVNGPALSARGRDVVIAWFTLIGEQGQAFAAFSRDAGRTFGRPIRLDDGGTQGRVDVVLLPDGSAMASYIEIGGERPAFHARRVEPSGARSAAIPVAGIEASRASGYPRMALHDGELTFAWIERDGELRVKTARARIPHASRPQ